MNTPEYKYDVAFSFCKEDEELAQKIYDLIGNRTKTFIYSKRQEDLVGFDGEERFYKIFFEESRVVVVLYRKKYGTTPWTRIEERAIKNRSLKEGYDFAIFIPVESVKLPKYYDETRIWYDLERYGINAAVSIIEKRITDLKGKIKEDNFESKARRLKKELDYKKQLDEYFNSPKRQYIDDAREEYNILREIVKQKLKKAADIFADNYQEGEKPNLYVFTYKPYQLEFILKLPFHSNIKVPEIEFLYVEYTGGTNEYGKANLSIRKKLNLQFHKNMLGENVWKTKNLKIEKDYTSEILAEEAVSEFIEFIGGSKKSNIMYVG